MSSIDERIVNMKFNSSQFEQGASKTMSMLDKLKSAMGFKGAAKGLQDVDSAVRKFSFAGMTSGVEGLSAKFVALGTIAITALANISNRAINAGITIAKSLTIDPIKQGFQEYTTNLNAIQTILANTKSKGSTLSDVNASLAELNTYADKTIYNFAEMARNIGTFTAAGVGLETSTSAIKGIANLAAVSGSNAQQASTAMYQLSQALASGRITLMDWNSVVNAGMGGEVFQEALKETARAHGVAVDAIIKKEGSFRESLQKGWITSDILTETLSKFTGDLTDAQLEQMGYTQEQIKGIQELAKTAQDAATKVKDVKQLFETLQEAAGSGWAKTWEILFGNFDEARTLWTGVSNALGGMIDQSSDTRNKILEDWKLLGGRTEIITAIGIAWQILMSIMRVVKDAFRDIFPPMTGERLHQMSVAIREFAAGLKLSGPAAENLKSTFRGLFALLDIGWMIGKGFLGVIFELIGSFAGVGGGVLEITGTLGEFIVSVRDAIKNGEGLSRFFDGLTMVLKAPIAVIKAIIGAIADLASGLSGTDIFAGIKARLSPLEGMGGAVEKAWLGAGLVLKSIAKAMKPLTDGLREFASGLKEAFVQSMENVDFSHILDAINTGLLAGLFLTLRKFLSGGIDFGGGFLESAKSTLEGLTDVLGAMQANLKADTLTKIAIAIALLAASALALSLVDSDRLASALTAIAVMLGELVVSMALFSKVVTPVAVAKFILLGAALILLAAALVIMSGAVLMLAQLDWEDLAKGLLGVTATLGLLSAAVKVMSGNSGGMIQTGAGLILLAVGVRILASAVKAFSDMDWESMARGLVGVAGALVALGIFTKFASAGKGAIASSVGLLIMAGALKLLASAVEDFSDMDWSTIARGLVAMAGALLVIAGAIAILPKSTAVEAVGLVIMAGALSILSDVLSDMGSMSWEEIARGLVALAGSLAILALGLLAMNGTLAGSAALIVAAGAIAILAPALKMLGGMTWGEIGKGLLTLAASLAILGVAGLVLTPVVPTLLLLGVAIALLGVGLAAAGIGVAAFAAGLVALGTAGAVAATGIVVMVTAIIALIPAILIAIAEGIVGMVQVLMSAAPVFLEAAVTFISGLLTAITILAPQIISTAVALISGIISALDTLIPQFTKTAVLFITALLTAIQIVGPQIIKTVVVLILALVNAVVVLVPRFVEAGMAIIRGILNGIARQIPGVVRAGVDIVVNFINAISANLGRVIQAGVNLIINFVNGLANGIRNNTGRMRSAGVNLAMAIVDGMTGGLASGVQRVVSAAVNLATRAFNAAKKALGISSPSKEFAKLGAFSAEGLAVGLDRAGSIVEHEAGRVGKRAITSLRASLSNVGDIVSTDINMEPTIRPVLDLTNVKKSADDIDALLSYRSIRPDGIRDYAMSASLRNSPVAAGGDIYSPTTNVTFQQTNNSPKALSSAEIYRQTRNQLSTFKGGLPV